MGITYEVLSWEYRYCHYGQAPSCATVAEAVRWLGPADFVVAVEDGVMRQLTADEQVEFESARSATWRKTSRTA